MLQLDAGDPTLEALRDVLRDIERNQKCRDYLGASQIGEPCWRKLWYGYHHPELKKPMEDKGHLATQCGHRAEGTMSAYLRMIDGVELTTETPQGGQIGFTDYGGKFSGHIDGMIRGLIQAPKTVHIWEHKDTNHKKFAEFQNLKAKHGEKEALKHWNIIYYGQAQIYMHYFEISRHYMTVSLSGVRDFDSCRTEYDKAYAESLKEKAKIIINSPEPLHRISDKRDYWMCRFCDFSGECHK